MRLPLHPLTRAVLALCLTLPLTAGAQTSPMELLQRLKQNLPGSTAAATPPAAEAPTSAPATPPSPPPTAPSASAATPAATPAADATSSPSAAAAEVAAPQPAQQSAPEGCRPLSDKATAVDLKALTAQSQKAELATQARLFDEAVLLWSQAVGVCEGRAKDRAQRNLNDSLKMRAGIQEQLGSGPQCAAAHKDAGSFQDMGRQALSERRWGEAAMLYRKAEDLWELASERCNGTQQEVAQRRREQAEIDSINAEHCAPAFEQAREQNQRLRTLAPGMNREEKQEASQMVETLWRDLLGLCKGPVLDTARSNAQALARERGTPWASTRSAMSMNISASDLRALGTTATNTAANTAAQSAAAQMLAPKVETATSALPGPAAAKATTGALGTAAAAGALQTGTAAPVQQAATAAQAAPVAMATAAAAATAANAIRPNASGKADAQPAEFTSGSTRFSGQFVRDADGATYSGTGRIMWANGDIYDGSLLKGQRHGKGQFIWANGQRYNGDWVRDKPTGQASVQFSNGNIYEGAVVNGMPHGQGRMLYASGDNYVGQFNAGHPEGRGVQTWKDGQRYDGEWQGEQPQGQGRMQFPGGETYVGQFAGGQPNGQGTFMWPNGDQYVGPWLAGQKHGQGVFTWKTGDRWEGVYDHDQQTAQGNLIRK